MFCDILELSEIPEQFEQRFERKVVKLYQFVLLPMLRCADSEFLNRC